MSTVNNVYSINYTKYHVYNDPFYYYCDKTGVKEIDPKNEFIEYIKKTKEMLKETTKKYLSLNYKQSFIDCESSSFNLKSLIKSHSFDIIWNPKVYYFNFHTSTFFLKKDTDNKYTVCVLTSKKTEDKKFYQFLSKFYYYALKQEVNKKLNEFVYFLPVSSDYLDTDNWFKYYITSKEVHTELSDIYNFINYKVEKCKVGVDIFPNMKNTYDYPYHSYKQKVANEIDEITQYYYCSVKERDTHLSKSARDYSTASFGIKNKSDKSKKIEGILKYRNKTNEQNPFKIYGNKKSLKEKLNELYNYTNLCFIDFEVVNGLLDISKGLDSFPKLSFHNCIFNIGLLVYNLETNKNVFHSFFLENINNSEHKLLKDFFSCIDSLENPVLIHWSNAELNFLNSFNKKGNTLLFSSYNYFDLHSIFNKYNVIVKGMKSFKLKELYTSIHKHTSFVKKLTEDLDFEKHIKLYKGGDDDEISIMNGTATTLSGSKVRDGLETIGLYLNQTCSKEQIMDIITYNFYDCYYLYNILKALRINFD